MPVQKMARTLVVVARDVDYLGALPCLAQDLLDDVVVRWVPVPPALQLPAIDDVADQIQVSRFGTAEKFQQRRRLAPRGAEVDIRDPDGAETQRAWRSATVWRDLSAVGCQQRGERRRKIARGFTLDIGRGIGS